MTRTTDSTTGDDVWQFVPPNAINPPGDIVDQRFVQRLQRWWRHALVTGKNTSAVGEQARLQALPAAWYPRLTPRSDWRRAHAALTQALGDWPEGSTSAPFGVVLGTPWNGALEALGSWAAEHRWRVIEPPGAARITACDQRWLDTFGTDSSPWLLPQLARCHLRRPDGLGLVRLLFERLRRGDLPPGLIGCDSWAWRYLQTAAGASAPFALGLQSLDGDRLGRWFGTCIDHRIRVLRCDNGHSVLPGDAEARHDASWLNRLAARCGGNAGVALILWRERLRYDATRTRSVDLPTTLWVDPWSRIVLPDLVDRPHRPQTLILHALLLHDGLDMAALESLLPLPAHELGVLLDALHTRGMLQREGSRWRVGPSGYPSARQVLHDDGFPDALQ